jgi:hypothetical protein
LAVRREAATSLCKIGDPGAVPLVLSALGGDKLDRVYEHALIFALIEINDREATAPGLAASSPQVQRAALIALDQMDDGNLTRDDVTPLLGTSDLALQRVAIDIISRHSNWSEEVVGIVNPILAAREPSQDQLGSARTLLIAFAGNQAVQDLIAKTLGDPTTALPVRQTLLDVIRDCNLPSLPLAWSQLVVGLLSAESEGLLDQAISIAERNPEDAFRQPLQEIGMNEKHAEDTRVRSLAASGGLELSDSALAFLRHQLDAGVPVTRRLAAARAIGSARLTKEQLLDVAGLVDLAGPLELASLLGAFEANTDAELGRKLLAALNDSPGLANLSPSVLDRLFLDSAV